MASDTPPSSVQPSEPIASGNLAKKSPSRHPETLVVAGIVIPKEKVWRLFLRMKHWDETSPFDEHGIDYAEVVINDFVRPYDFRFISWGEGLDADGYIFVTRSKWFKEGYMGMPDELVPHYPAETEAETRGRNFLESQKVEGAQDLEFRSMLMEEDDALF